LNSNKFKSTTAVLLLLVLTSFPSFAAGETKDDSSVQMDSLLTEIYPSDGPGASILVVKDGKTILRRAYGIGNLELNVPLSSKMVFRIGSVTKQFTSAGIMKMVEQGKLKVSDPITLYLPGYPTHGHNITIENLLTHTSGIKSYTSMGETMKEIVNEDLTVDELVDSFKDAPMDFAPSTAYKYSNSGYALLGAIIEKISGKSYTDYIQDEFFTPLGMTSSYYGSFTKIIPNRAMGYQVIENGFLNAEYISIGNHPTTN
jgi:CubicO group peptidase (beta-lactamase class C family)